LPFHHARQFARIAPVKFAASLSLASVLLLTACNNLVTRRDLYVIRGGGPYTEAKETGRFPTKRQLTPKSTPKPGLPEEKENPLPQ
jgi:hypothetical protein